MPAELIEIMETKGREVAEVLRVLMVREVV
jgi:hypothetical protein